MSDISRASLFGKLNPLSYRAIESATLFCKMRGNAYVELSHWLHQFLQQTDSDLHLILRHFEVDASLLARDLTRTLDQLPRGATSVSDLAIHVEESVERAWVYASLLFGQPTVRSGHIVVGWQKTPTLRNALRAISSQFDKLKQDELIEQFDKITEHSAEVTESGTTSANPSSTASNPGAATLGKGEALARYSVDLTEKARSGQLDPIVGRSAEIRQLIAVLLRRRQNNPLLTGEAGVGKTAIVEGFAQEIANGTADPSLNDTAVHVLDIGLLQAGASMKGEFESRLRQVIDEVQSSETPIILFIDEAHTLIGAGGAQGTGDAANLLKPALARGTLRTIAATTWDEYKKYIEPDPALVRRFQVISIQEPDEDKALLMMRGIAAALETHHGVQVLDEALLSAVKLSKRFIVDRQLPDKAVSLLDTACARVAISLNGKSPQMEDTQRQIASLAHEIEIIERERKLGVSVGKRKEEVQSQLKDSEETLATLTKRWQSERALVDLILTIRGKIQKETGSSLEPLVSELTAVQLELRTLQGDEPSIFPTVDHQSVAAVVSDWTGIPAGRMGKNEIEAILSLDTQLAQRVMGQDHALKALALRLQTSRARLENPNKPIGVFLLAGPSGVGKTETALALAEALYGGEQNVITINMSEFQESHTVSTLKGAPPGYKGYESGGVLTEAVRRRPYSIVLLDEIEKAHSDVHELFFQAFDKGSMEDGKGTHVDFKNTIILLTTNVGSEEIMKACQENPRPTPSKLKNDIREKLLATFPAAWLGRMDVLPYFSLSDEMMGNIVRLQLRRIESRVQANYGVPFTYEQSVVTLITSRCTEVESGGRMIDSILTSTLLPQVSRELLTRSLEGQDVARVHISVEHQKFVYSYD